MRIEHTRRLRGPNVYLSRPVLVARLDLAELTGRETTPAFAHRLVDALPGLAEHHCAAGEPGGFVRRLHGGTYFGHVAEHVAIELSRRIERKINFGRTVYAGDPGRYDVVLECPVDEPAGSGVGERLLRLAVRVVTDLLAGREPQLDLAAVATAYEHTRPGPSTVAIMDAARRRGIPVERLGELSLLRLGYGSRRHLVWAALTDQTGAVGVDIAGDKYLTRQLLDDAGVPVPAGGLAATPDDALARYADLGPPVVVKPRYGRQGRHVYLGLTTPAAVQAAFLAARAEHGDVVVERQLDGRDYRVLVVNGEVVAAAERTPAHVVGDGVTEVAGLVARANDDPRRGVDHGRALTRLTLDGVAAGLLSRQGHGWRSVPAPGEVVWLRDNANLSTGGTSRDVTDDVHPDVAALCRRVAALVGLDVAGVDLRLPAIDAPLVGPLDGPTNGAGGGVIEVNAAPGLRMHLSPTAGRPRDVAACIVDALYPPGDRGRVPTVAVTGTNGKTTTARLAAHLLAAGGRRVGVTTTDGVYLDGRLVRRADATGPRSAQIVLGDPTVDVAVLETARGGMLRAGLGYDWTDVGVVTNIGHDHLGQDGLATVEDIAHVKALVAERVRDGGTLVLNADDPLVRDLVRRPAVRAAHKNVVWFSLNARDPLVARHRRGGGRGYLLDDGWLVEVTGDRSQPLIAVAELPGAFGGAARYVTANALAAVAAARALGVPVDVAADRLCGFQPWEGNPGRGMLLRVGAVDVLLDYAHNPGAIAAVTDVLHRVWGKERAIAVVTLPGDRRDDLLRESARTVADGFDRVVLYEDVDPRGRAAGEVPRLVRGEINRYRPHVACTTVTRVDEAIAAALARADAGDVVLVLHEKVQPALDLLKRLGASPVSEPVPSVRVGRSADREQLVVT